MQSYQPTVMDLEKLRSEILIQSPQAALPCNLSDFWLAHVGENLEQVLEVGGDEAGKYMAGPLALILHVLHGKIGSDKLEISDDQMFQYFVDYRIEVALEEVNRRSDIKSTSATLERIFTNRSIETVRKQG